jgi:hypothetical protein
VAPRRKHDGLLIHWLLATWRKIRRWLVWVGGNLRNVDIRKPVHAVVIGVVVAGIAAPVFDYLATEARYRLADDQTRVMGHASTQLTKFLSYDKQAQEIYFNKDGQPVSGEDNMLKLGSGGDKQLYSAKMPVKAGAGIRLTDAQHRVSATMSPQFSLLDGRQVGSRVLYPLKNDAGVLALTPKGNGMKEDIVLDGAPADRMQYDYKLSLDAGLEARVAGNGAIGVYSGDPALFGNISFGSDTDRTRVMNARKVAPKNYLMFEIPAPVVKQADGGQHGVKARFMLQGDTLSVVVTGLAKAAYPLSIDPSFVITTQSDFLLGRVEDNLTLTITSGTDAQLNRAKISGGNLNSWATAVAGNLPNGCSAAGLNYNFGLTAYNGFLYLVGGGDAVAHTCYAAINSNGTLGSWAATTTTFPTGRTGAQIFGFNGFIYVIGGESANGNTQYKDVEWAPVTSSGDITQNPWNNSSSYFMGTARVNFGVVEYDGYAYACGGATAKNNGTLVSTCEYTKINTDGTFQRPTTGCTLAGTATNWCTTNGFTGAAAARNRFGMVAYNGFVYAAGGLTNNGGFAVTTEVQYAPIQNDNTLGTWSTTTAVSGVLSGGWRSGGIAAEDGHLYLIGGCTTSAPSCNSNLLAGSYFSPINADGTLGRWDTSTSITTARLFNSGTSYNGVLYSIGGCTNEPANSNNCNAGGALGDSQYAIINGTLNSAVTYPGSLLNYATGGSVATARNGAATVAYGGFLFAAGGCNGTNCGTAVSNVDSAPLNDDGTVGTWTNQASGGLFANRYGGALVGFRGKLYYLGGNDTTGAKNTVFSATPSGGTISSTWTNETNTFATARYWHSAAVYQNYIYIWGGLNGGTAQSSVEYTKIDDSGNFATPANCTTNNGGTAATNNWCPASNHTLGTARYGFGGVAYGGYLYAVVGIDNGGAALNTVERAAISSADGYPGAWSTSGQTSLTDTNAGHKFVSATVSKGVIYVIGGINTAGTPAVSNTTSYGALDASGNLATWNTSRSNLATARWGTGAATAGGKIYAVGGCSVTSTTCSAYLASAEYTQVINGGTGMTSQVNASTWSSGTALSSARADFMAVAFNAKVYIIGGCTAYTSGACSTWTTEVRHATINGDGSLGSWSATSGGGSDAQLATARAQGGAIAYAGHIYVVGGSTGTGSNLVSTGVLYATLDATGVITGWTDTSTQTTSGVLPAGRSLFGMGTSGGYLYVAGGCTAFTSGSCTTRNNDVIYTQMSETGPVLAPNCSDGTLTRVWCASNNNFTGARQELTALGYNAALYVMGGYDGTNNLGDVQYATIGSDGSLSTFSYTSYQDRLQRSRNTVSANGFIYTMGDESSGTQVQYMPINANHTLGEQSRASSAGMANAHAHGQVVFNDGFFYALGGCTLSGSTCSAAITNVDYVGQKANARKGHYAKMFNTEVNTAPALVQVNGTGQYVIEMRTAAVGSTQLGVAQVITPAYASKFYFLKALDTSGTDVGIAFDYFIFLTIDDSQTGPFPDVGSTATDVNVYYHPNPGRRLRHGASFTNTGCNRVITDGCLLDTAQ